MAKNPEPPDDKSIECHLQKIGMGTLICSAARQTGRSGTNEVMAANCLECDAGRIYREVGCDAVSPKIHIFQHSGGSSIQIESLFCKIRKRYTDIEYCRRCDLVTAETTRNIVSQTRGLFQAQGYASSFKEIEKSRKDIRDGHFDRSITSSLSSLESTMRVIHDKMEKELPKKKQLSEIYKSTRRILHMDKIATGKKAQALMNSLNGVITHLGSLRNELSDSHGKGLFSPEVSESVAELALNISSSMSTMMIRRYNQVKEEYNE